MSDQISLIVGLGNPGDEYANTRHNAGFWLVDQLASSRHASFNLESKFFAEIAKFRYNDKDVLLIKPQTYMNLSGKAVAAVSNFYKIPVKQILVVHDELDFVPGVVKLKLGGGNGGHNGLKDIDKVIGKDYWRVRLGIGHPGDRNLVVSYVLKKPPSAEVELIEASISKLLSYINSILDYDFEYVLKQIHSK